MSNEHKFEVVLQTVLDLLWRVTSLKHIRTPLFYTSTHMATRTLLVHVRSA